VFETADMLVEAPNWSGTALYVNGNGALWRLELDQGRFDAKLSEGRELTRVTFERLPDLNNDHCLAPDGRHIYMSAMDGHIYRGTLDGGPVERVTPDDGSWHFLHGVAPDGARLAYVHMADFDSPGRLAVLEPHGQPVIIDTGDGHIDGPEWSPDGEFIYFNTEGFTTAPGHAQLARIADRGGPAQRLVTSETVDWFPHLSPDARYATYIAFPPGTLGHPADVDVEVRLVETSDWSVPIQRYPLFGGQGTINVNSWSPDSGRFAFVAYPMG
jgi:Tol biopolymer transport system component